MEVSLEERIARLEAIRAIEVLIADLARAFDRSRSGRDLFPLFTEDAVFRIDKYGSLEGAAAIANGVAANTDAGFKWTLHYLVSPKISLRADFESAAVEFMLFEAATATSGKAYWIAGTYLSEVVCQSGAWRFAELELRADLISHYPDGWKEKPATLAHA